MSVTSNKPINVKEFPIDDFVQHCFFSFFFAEQIFYLNQTQQYFSLLDFLVLTGH
jgi:hypothetical protein